MIDRAFIDFISMMSCGKAISDCDLLERQRVFDAFLKESRNTDHHQETANLIKSLAAELAKYQDADFITYGKNGKLYVDTNALASYISDRHPYVRIHGERNDNETYFYNSKKGVYERKNETEIRIIIRKAFQGVSDKGYDDKIANDVLRNLQTQSIAIDINDFDNYPDLILFKNGIYNITDDTLANNFTHMLKFRTAIPCKWLGHDTPTPVFDKFIADLANGDKAIEKLLLEIIGAVISNVDMHRFKSCFFLQGAGNTGKSKYYELINELIGDANIYNCSLKDMEESRFALQGLVGKRLIGHSENGSASIATMDKLKTITGDQGLEVDRKYLDKLKVKFRGAVLYCMNELPLFEGDKGSHVYDRMIIIPCHNVIPESERNPDIVNDMMKEADGIVYKAVQALKGVLQRGKFTMPEKVLALRKEYQEMNSPAISFFNEHCTKRTDEHEKNRSKRSEVYRQYRYYMSRNYPNVPHLTARAFHSEISKYLGYTDPNTAKYKYNGDVYGMYVLETKVD